MRFARQGLKKKDVDAGLRRDDGVGSGGWHPVAAGKAWMAGSSPAMTWLLGFGFFLAFQGK
jgi:hypothetical protein